MWCLALKSTVPSLWGPLQDQKTVCAMGSNKHCLALKNTQPIWDKNCQNLIFLCMMLGAVCLLHNEIALCPLARVDSKKSRIQVPEHKKLAIVHQKCQKTTV